MTGGLTYRQVDMAKWIDSFLELYLPTRQKYEKLYVPDHEVFTKHENGRKFV
jgi:hypothetical protein